MNRLQYGAVVCGSTIAAIAGCYFFVDRPLAWWINGQLSQFKEWFSLLTLIPEPLPVVAVLVLVALAARSLTGRLLSRLLAVALLWSLAVLVTTTINRQLKFAFGRSWPETWTGNNPSFLRDGVYGFHPFHGGAGFAAFPSGHMAVITVAMTVLWIAYPRLWPLYALLIALVAIGLVGANYHFIGDVVAGGFVGAAIGLVAFVLWEAGGQRSPGPPVRTQTRRKRTQS
jgi:membrane-associated phospholipid phosphatase